VSRAEQQRRAAEQSSREEQSIGEVSPRLQQQFCICILVFVFLKLVPDLSLPGG
jgi:hypothetical protein